MFQMFKSGQGIPRVSFGIALFLVQDVTLQAGFHSSSNKPTAHSLFNILSSDLHATKCLVLEKKRKEKQFPPTLLVHKHVRKVKVCICPSSTLTWERL